MTTALNVSLVDPIVCRSPGLPFERALHSSPDELWRLLDDAAFCDCLATMNPGVFPGLRSRRAKLRPGHRPSNVRRAEMTLYRYLVRFCSRNDTTGTAGSTVWGRLGEETVLLPGAGAACLKTVWVSPRHAELLAHRAAFGPLREKAGLVLFPRFVWKSGQLSDAHCGENVELSSEEQALLTDLTQLGGPAAESLIARGILTLRLGQAQEDPFEAVCRAATGSVWEEPLQKLAALQIGLEAAHGEPFARLLQEADALAENLFQMRSLDASKVLRHMCLRALQVPATFLCATPDAVQDECTPAERQIIARAQEPAEATALGAPAAELFAMMERGLLSFAPRPPSRAALRGLMQQTSPAAAPWSTAARLYGASWPSEPIRYNPLAAESDLASWLGEAASQVDSPGFDRSFFLCDSRRDVESFRLGSALRDRLESQLQAWFRLGGWQEYYRERSLVPAVRQVMEGRQEMPLSLFLPALTQQLSAQQEDLDSPAQRAAAELWSLGESNWRGTPDYEKGCLQIGEHLEIPAFEEWLRDKRLVTTLDVMLGGATAQLDGGQGTLLISEAHCGGDGLGVTSFYPQAHPNEAMGPHIFGDDTLFMQPLVPTKQSPGILKQLSEAVLVITNPEGYWPNRRTIPIGELKVVRVADGIEVSDGRRNYRLITEHFTVGNIRTVGFAPLSLVRWICYRAEGFAQQGPDEAYPELRMGDLILARALVQLSGERARHWLGLDPSGGQLRRAFALPRFVFVTTHKKPMLCDFESPLSLEVLQAEIAGASLVRLTPMQPAPEELWLHMEGRAYASELRMLACAQGPNFSDGPAGRSLRY